MQIDAINRNFSHITGSKQTATNANSTEQRNFAGIESSAKKRIPNCASVGILRNTRAIG
jgi:hypothetical protein